MGSASSLDALAASHRCAPFRSTPAHLRAVRSPRSRLVQRPRRASLLAMSHFDGDTPAHLRAAFAGDVSAVEAWLSGGGDVNQDGGWDGSLLSNAIVGSQTQMYDYLLARGARCGEADLYSLVDEVLSKQYAGRDHADVVRLLIEHGADPTSGAPTDDFDPTWTLLHKLAAMMTADDYHLPQNPAAETCALLIPLLVDKGVPVDVRCAGSGGSFPGGSTPLMVAAFYSAPVFFLRELLRHGADLFAKNDDDDDALLYAMMAPHLNNSTTSAADKRVNLAFLLNVKEAGTYKRYVNEPRKRLLVLLKLCERGRASAPRRGLLARLFPSPRRRVASGIASDRLPDVLFWKVLSFWRTERDGPA